MNDGVVGAEIEILGEGLSFLFFRGIFKSGFRGSGVSGVKTPVLKWLIRFRKKHLTHSIARGVEKRLGCQNGKPYVR